VGKAIFSFFFVREGQRQSRGEQPAKPEQETAIDFYRNKRNDEINETNEINEINDFQGAW